MFDAIELEVNHRQGEQITLKIKHYTRLTALLPLLSLGRSRPQSPSTSPRACYAPRQAWGPQSSPKGHIAANPLQIPYKLAVISAATGVASRHLDKLLSGGGVKKFL